MGDVGPGGSAVGRESKLLSGTGISSRKDKLWPLPEESGSEEIHLSPMSPNLMVAFAF